MAELFRLVNHDSLPRYIMGYGINGIHNHLPNSSCDGNAFIYRVNRDHFSLKPMVTWGSALQNQCQRDDQDGRDGWDGRDEGFFRASFWIL